MNSLALRLLVAGLVVAGMLGAAQVSYAADELKGVQLKWVLKPKDEAFLPLDLGTNANKTFRIEKLVDKRSNPTLIGENREKDVKPVSTTEDVAAFATVNVKKLLAGAGFKFSDGDADYIITGELTEFFCQETNLYRARVGYKLTIKGKGGKVLWAGSAADHSNRFGRSFRADVYLDALDNALAGATKKLIEENDSFRTAIRGG